MDERIVAELKGKLLKRKGESPKKRKAESPKLVVELQTAKRTKIIPTKTLQSFLTTNLDYADHIQVKYSDKTNPNYNPVKMTDQNCNETDGQGSFEKLLKKTDTKKEYEGTEIMKLLTSVHPDLTSFKFKSITAKDLELKYCMIFPPEVQKHILGRLENEIQYSSEEESRIRIFGRWCSIPRKQVAFGDSGLTYKFSGNRVSALDWTPLTRDLLNIVNTVTRETFNFVLINRYKDGKDHIGEHRDDEPDLDLTAPIASLSFGAARDFVLRHKDLRSKKAKVDPVTVKLESGSLLLMNPPTNLFWYHSLPVRKNCFHPRINMTFRKIKRKNLKK